MNQIYLAFLTGLTTGGISCFAVQGGLLASTLSDQPKEKHKKVIMLFLLAKLLAYTLLGVLLGFVGSSLIISPKVQGWMQVLAGLFMLITVAKLLDLHPVFRRFSFTPPKSIFRYLRKKSIDKSLISTYVLGFLTILIPCGVTQAIMLLSVSSSNAFTGGAIMFSFILGTTPVFFGLGLASSEIFKHRSLKYAAAGVITILALMSINSGQILRGSVHTLQNYYLVATEGLKEKKIANAANINEGKQEATINVTSYGYQSETRTLKVNVPVKLTLNTNNVLGCSRSFTIPEYNISKLLPQTGTETLEFTPTKTGLLTYTCSMGMYTGYFNVI
jgi:uncharacterized protein